MLKCIGIYILPETKLDETFLTSQFLMYSFFKPYRFDRNKHGAGVTVYIRDTIPSKILKRHSCPNDMECLFIEFQKMQVATLRNVSHPPSQNDAYDFNYLDKALDFYSNDKHFLLVGDFNTEHYIEPLLYENELSNLTCFKNMQNPRCIDLLLTNNSYAFRQSTTVCSGLSDM